MCFQVYRPLEFLFVIAAFTTLAENFLPQLIAIPRVRCQFLGHAPFLRVNMYLPKLLYQSTVYGVDQVEVHSAESRVPDSFQRVNFSHEINKGLIQSVRGSFLYSVGSMCEYT